MISKDISINKEKAICILNKESISGQKYERIYMGTKCEVFVNYSQNFVGICKKQV